MSAHLTVVVAGEHVVLAYCLEHGRLDPHTKSAHGMNLAILDARAHDDMKHGVYRTESQYRARLLGDSVGDDE